jgi:hypothetical protein
MQSYQANSVTTEKDNPIEDHLKEDLAINVIYPD